MSVRGPPVHLHPFTLSVSARKRGILEIQCNFLQKKSDKIIYRMSLTQYATLHTPTKQDMKVSHGS